MTTTTSYGSWNRATGDSSLTLHGSVESALNGEFTEAEVDQVADLYREAINAALPDSVALCGDEFYGPYYEADYDFDGYPQNEDGFLDLAAIVEGVDFWEIVEEVTAS